MGVGGSRIGKGDILEQDGGKREQGECRELCTLYPLTSAIHSAEVP